MEKDNLTRQPQKLDPAADEMTEQDLDEVSGGIIVIGGKLEKVSIGSLIGKISLNPQPLPPKTLYL